MDPQIKRITDLLSPVVTDMGYELVLVRFTGQGRSFSLQIMAEREDETPLTLQDCTDISRAVSAILDVEDVIDGAFRLEISSPGLERPLTRVKDYERFKDKLAKIELHDAVDDRKRFKAILMGVNDDDEVLLALEDEKDTVITLSFSSIYRAKLIVSDEDFKVSRPKNKKSKRSKANKKDKQKAITEN